MPVGRPFDGFVEYTKRVSPTCLVNFDRNCYSAYAVIFYSRSDRHSRSRTWKEATLGLYLDHVMYTDCISLPSLATRRRNYVKVRALDDCRVNVIGIGGVKL